MIKTSIKDGICLIMINTTIDNMLCLKIIKEEFSKRKIKIFYSSVSNYFGNGERLVIAVSENDVYPMLTTFGCIKDDAKILNYSISYSNSMIKWEDATEDITLVLKNILEKVKLICEYERNGILFCESQHIHKVIANIEK